MKKTQGRKIIEHLNRRPMTSMQIQMLGISTCWWRRVSESLAGNERLLKAHRKGQPTIYRIVRIRRHAV